MVWIRPNKTQKSIEAELRAMLDLLTQFGTPLCLQHGHPEDLMCQVAFPYCSENSDGIDEASLMCPSWCTIASHKFCSFEFKAARLAVDMDPATFGMFTIPACDSLPSDSDEIYSCGVYQQNKTDIGEHGLNPSVCLYVLFSHLCLIYQLPRLQCCAQHLLFHQPVITFHAVQSVVPGAGRRYPAPML